MALTTVATTTANNNKDFDNDADRASEDEDPNYDGAQDPDIKPERGPTRLITRPDDVKPRWQTGSHPKHTLESPSHPLVTPGIAPRPGSYPVHPVPSRVTTTRVTHTGNTQVQPGLHQIAPGPHPGHKQVTWFLPKVTPMPHEGCAQSCLGGNKITHICTRVTPGHARPRLGHLKVSPKLHPRNARVTPES